MMPILSGGSAYPVGLDSQPMCLTVPELRLRDDRGLPSGVEFPSNKSKTDSKVNVSSFKGWGDLEVVHVVSHGTRICKDSSCRAVIAA